MATIEKLRTELIDNILAIKSKDMLMDLSNYISIQNQSTEPRKFSKYQKLMLEMSEDDIKNGRVYTEDEVDKMDEEWLN
jgi:hypothetical protein